MTLKVLSQEDIKKHQDEGRTVLIVDGKVYAVDDSFTHPGGFEYLSSHDGQDVSHLFDDSVNDFHSHSKGAKVLLDIYLVGYASAPVDGTLEKTPVKSTIDSFGIDESKALVWQVPNLGSKYLAWVDEPSSIHPRFFESKYAEAVTVVQWWMVPLIWIPVALYHMITSNMEGLTLLPLISCIVFGVLVWQFVEYTLHRFLFHMDPVDKPRIFVHFLLHGCHHKYPMDMERLVFPPAPALAIALVIRAIVLGAFTSNLAAGKAVISGILLGYISYDMIHYWMHAGRINGVLKTRHMKHHFVSHETGFGISCPLFDWLFGTLPSEEGMNASAQKLMAAATHAKTN